MAIGKINTLNWERIGNGATIVNQEPWGGGGGGGGVVRLTYYLIGWFQLLSKFTAKPCTSPP